MYIVKYKLKGFFVAATKNFSCGNGFERFVAATKNF